MIIGISGKAQSGKDTVGDYLVKKYKFVRVASADLLKEIVEEELGWDGIKDEKGRQLLQEIGCAVRNYDADFWINRTLRRIAGYRFAGRDPLTGSERTDFVITDVRFKNEARILKANGATILRLERTNIIKYDHISEVELDDYKEFDAIIRNDGSMDELYDKIDTTYRSLICDKRNG